MHMWTYKSFIKWDGIYGHGDQALVLLQSQCADIMAQDHNHYHQKSPAWRSLLDLHSEHVGNEYLNDELVDLFWSGLTSVISPSALVQCLVFETQHASGSSPLFPDIEKTFISLEEHSTQEGNCGLEGENSALNPNPLAHSNCFQRQHLPGQARGHGNGKGQNLGLWSGMQSCQHSEVDSTLILGQLDVDSNTGLTMLPCCLMRLFDLITPASHDGSSSPLTMIPSTLPFILIICSHD